VLDRILVVVMHVQPALLLAVLVARFEMDVRIRPECWFVYFLAGWS
jgi:hypothetical protein